MKDLRELEKRLEEATEGQWWTSEEADRWTVAIFGPKATFVDWGMLTAAFKSLDAAVALVERMGFWASFDGYGKLGAVRDKESFVLTEARAATPVLSIDLALIRALIAKGDRHD